MLGPRREQLLELLRRALDSGALSDQDRGLLARFLPLDMTKRDPGAARDSFNEFAQLTTRFPNSRYSPDVKARMVYLRNLLAANEIHVADYYLRRQAYVAAANRGRYVVENFQGSPVVADGVAIMVECYLRLGMNELADTSLALLKSNYPDHPALDASGNFIVRNQVTNPSMLYIVSFGLLGSNVDNTPLAPTTRPEEFQNPVVEEVPDPDRSWFSRMTRGIFN